MAETLIDFFQNPESKMANPRGIGELQRRHLQVVDQVFIGKETSEVLEELQDESGGVLAYEDAQRYGRTGVARAIEPYSDVELMDATGLPRQTIRDLRSGTLPRRTTRTELMEGLSKLAGGRDASQ